MEIGEAVAKFEADLGERTLCNPPGEAAAGHTAQIKELAGPPPTGTRLADNMVAHGVRKPAPPLDGGRLRLTRCDRDSFPAQAHHLIPKDHLPRHGVCAFLSAKYTHNPGVRLEGDTAYETDDHRNGYFLPYASPLVEWRDHRKTPGEELVAFELMRRTERQIHEGPHSAVDFVDDDSLVTDGYLAAVDKLLRMIQGRAWRHAVFCRVCCPSPARPLKLPPPRWVAGAMHDASACLATMIQSDRIFVSRRAAEYFLRFRNRAGTVVHAAEPLL